MISIIIPAHNEEQVIERCLSTMCAGAEPGELEVIVVCNACTDRTAELAAGHGDPVRVIETPIGSKSHALNLGDQEARCFPRFYVDADIVVSLDSIRAVARNLESGVALVGAPRIRFDLAGRSWPVRAYYEIWTRLPYISESSVGSGIYAMSKEGRERFGEFPDIFAEDSYVRALFAPEERSAPEGSSFLVTPPSTLAGIVRVNARRRIGFKEFGNRYPELKKCEKLSSHQGALIRLALRPRRWPALAVYVATKFATIVTHTRRYWLADRRVWDRDESSRSGTVS